MKPKKVMLVVGARPNFMKLAPLFFELKRNTRDKIIVVHTGQHYDYEMSQAFFVDLQLPKPDYFLGVKGNSQIEQIGMILTSFERTLLKELPDLVVVFGDVNSTIACAFTAQRWQIPVAHVESGLRSFDETMPEEINRKLTDAISQLLFTTSVDDNRQLKREGIREEKAHLVGDIMIDSLVKILSRIKKDRENELLQRFQLERNNFCLVTLHRPVNVDQKNQLQGIMRALVEISRDIKVIFPIHPRTRNNLKKMRIAFSGNPNLVFAKPLSYSDFIILEKNSRFVLTDSGGIQAETTFLGIPCLTLRPNTERPLTIKIGTNKLVSLKTVQKDVQGILRYGKRRKRIPPYWDGKTAVRIRKVISQWLNKKTSR